MTPSSSMGSTYSKDLLSIVVPVLDEERILPQMYLRLKNVLNTLSMSHEILFVDDGSQDGSFMILQALAEKDSSVKVIRFSRNFGHQIAITAGMDYSRGEVVVVIDGDLQDPPELIPELLEKWREGFDIVYAVRRKRKGESFVKLFTAYLFYRIIGMITRIHIPSDTGDFRLMSNRTIEKFRMMREQHRLIRGMVSWLGFKQTGVYYERDVRYAGKTKFGWIKMIRFAIDGITSFSRVPLKLATGLGFLVSFLSFIKIIELVINRYRGTSVPGWTSIMVAVLFLGGVQLISIGIIGEYIGRIHEEVKERPLYLIEDAINLQTDIHENHHL